MEILKPNKKNGGCGILEWCGDLRVQLELLDVLQRLGIRLRVSNMRYRASSFGFEEKGFEFGVSGPARGIRVSGFRVSGPRDFGNHGLGFSGVSVSGFRVRDSLVIGSYGLGFSGVGPTPETEHGLTLNTARKVWGFETCSRTAMTLGVRIPATTSSPWCVVGRSGFWVRSAFHIQNSNPGHHIFLV